MSSCDNSNIKKNYIVTSTEIDILSACTGFYTNDIYPCSGDTIIVHSDILSANTINSSVFLSGGTNLLDIFSGLDTNTFVTGVTYDNSNNLSVDRNDGVSFEVNISEFSGLTINGVLSACTGVYTTNLYGCSPITVQDDLILLSGLTLSAITNDDSLSEILVRDSVTGLVKYRDVSSITPDTNTFVTGVTYTKDYAVLTRNDNVDVLKLSGGTNVVFNNPSPNEIVIDVTIPPDTNTFVTGFTYDDSNNLTISRNDGTGFTTNIDIMSGLTINGDLLVTGTTNISGLTSINSSLDVYNGTIGLRDNDYFLQGTSTGGTNVQLIGVYSNNEILIGNQGYTNRIMDDTIIKGELDILSGLTLSQTPTLNNSGTDILIRNSSTGEVEYRPVSGITPDTNTFVTGQTFNNSTYILSTTRNDGFTINTNLSVLATDVYVLSGTYNPSTGIVTYTNSTGGTFQVSGFTTGMTDSYTTNSYLNGTQIRFDNNIQGTNFYNVDLLPVLSGKTDLTLFNSHTGDTNNPHQTSFNNLTSTAHTHTLSNITDFNSYSGSVQTQLDSKIEDGINVGGANEVFKNKSGTTLNFRTLTGGTNTTLTTIGDTIRVDVTIPPDTNTFVTGGTYNESNDTITLTRNDAVTIDITGVTDTFTTGGTYDNGTELITFVRNDGNNYTVDLSTLDINDTFVTGGTYNDTTDIITFTNNSGGTFDVTGITDNFVVAGSYSDSTDTISLLRQDGSFVNITGITDNFVSGGTYNSGTNNINFSGNNVVTTFDVDLSSLISSVSGDTFVISGNADVATSQLTFTNNSGGTFNVTNSAALFSDNDINVTGGTYDNNTGCVTFTTNSGTSFDVCGFVTGLTDTFTTGSTLVGETIQFDSNILGPNYYNVSLSPVLSGKTDNSTFNSYTSNTETILNSKVSGATNLSTTGLFAQKNGDNLEFKGLTSTGGTVTITNDSTTVNLEVTIPSDTNTFVTGGTYNESTDTITFTNNTGGTFNVTGITDTFTTGGTYDNGTALATFTRNDGNSYTLDLSTIDVNDTFSTGGTVTQSATSGSSEVIVQIVGNDGFTPYNITGLTDTFITDFSISSNTFTISQNDGSSFVATADTIDLASELSAVTFDIGTSGSISATTFNGGTFNGTFVGDGSGLTGITDNDTFVTGTTFASNQITLTRNDNVDVFSLSGGSNVTLSETATNDILIDVSLPPSMNTYVTGGTYNESTDTITLTRNDAVTVDITGVTDNFVVAGSYSDSTDTISLLRQDGSFVNITGVTDTFTTGSTYDNGTALATFTKNDGTTYTLDLSTIDVNDTFLTGFTYNDANTLTISRNDGVDLSTSINTMTGLTVNGTLVVDTLSATTYTGLTLNDLDDVTTGIPTTPDNTYQGRVLYFDVDTNEWLSTEEYVSTGTVTIWGKKGSAGTIAKGLPVYIVGFDDDIHEVELANASTGATMPVIGFTGEEFDNTNTRPLVTFGKLTGLDTTSTVSTLNPNGETWAVNDVLYVSTTTGGLTKFRPTGTNTQIQRIAKILKVGTTDGQLFIFNTARTAGLPNLTTDYLWVGNGNDTPQEVIRTDVGITTTGFTYNDNNTFTITDDNGGSLSSTINQMSGLTINGTLSATTLDGDTILSGGTNLTTVIESLDTYVTGGTVSVPATDNTNSGNIGLFYKNSDGIPRTLPFEDTYTTGSTYDNGTALATFNRNDGNSYTLDLSTIDVNDTFVTGTTFSSNQATVTRNDGTDVLLLTGGTNVTLSNPSTNQIKIDVASATPTLSVVSVTGTTYSATTSDDVIGFDTSSVTPTLFLPDSTSSGTKRYEVKDIGFNSRRNPITIQAAGSDLILTTQSTKSFDLSADGGAVILVSTGTGQWWQM